MLFQVKVNIKVAALPNTKGFTVWPFYPFSPENKIIFYPLSLFLPVTYQILSLFLSSACASFKLIKGKKNDIGSNPVKPRISVRHRVITKDVKNGYYCCYVRCAIYS